MNRIHFALLLALMGALAGCLHPPAHAPSRDATECPPETTVVEFGKLMSPSFAPDYEGCPITTVALFYAPSSMMDSNLGEASSVVFEVSDPSADGSTVDYVRVPKKAARALFKFKKGDKVTLVGSPERWGTMGGVKTHFFEAQSIAPAVAAAAPAASASPSTASTEAAPTAGATGDVTAAASATPPPAAPSTAPATTDASATPPTTTTVADSRGSSGESCTKTSDCSSGLKCLDNVCMNTSLGSEGDECTKSSECNAHLKCSKGQCAPRATKRRHGDGGDDDERASARDEALDGPDFLRGFQASSGLGLGGGSGHSSQIGSGFAYDLTIDWRFTKYFGAAIVIASTSLSHGITGTGEMIGLHLGHVFHVDLLLGNVSIGGGDLAASSLGVGFSAGFDIGLARSWALTPRFMAVAPTGINAVDVIYEAVLGITWRIPRKGD
ncbi:MAG: hypothetical protein ACHREM_05010 [Polyangiales bacterium]